MFRTMYKLARSFGEQPGPQRIANNVKGKIDKFKAHLPMLGVICNPGIRDRHWERVRRAFLNFYIACTPTKQSKSHRPTLRYRQLKFA